VTEIQPKIAPFEDELNKKLMACPFVETLEADPAYAILLRRVRCALDLYREENITLQAEESEESQKFGAISAAQSIEQNGKTLTMQQAGLLLKEPDEALRKTVFDKMTVRRAEDIEPLHALFDQLLKIRHTIAINAGFENYRDYKMAAMGRFDYGVEDCFDFHRSIKECIVPIVKELQKEKLALLGKSAFKPWDLSVDPEGRLPLKPFEKGEELLAGSIRMFDRIDPYFGDCLRTMNEMQHLDLESKPGKAPGGYNYPLYEIGVPFIFMNAVGSQQDVVTMVHEGGHAVHSFLSRDLKLTGFKNLPSEVAELASMSMELLTMEHWNELYTDSSELLRAQKEQLESILKILPWIAQVDEFQHWLYTHPAHTHVERTAQWMELNRAYGTGLTDWSGYEGVQETSWQRQLHIFEVPFYYIEYGIAQLGALQVWMRSLENKTKAVEDYKNALRLAYTKSIPEIYATAGIKFDFSIGNLRDLAGFIDVKLKTLRA
jgi:oligoendopeptidase F